MLRPGDQIDLAIEKPAHGGRMIARCEGQVVLVMGAIPGERVQVRVERVERRMALATTVRVLDPSPDRREGQGDPLCGGCVYSHIAYPAQLGIKASVIADAFVRIGRTRLEAPVPVAASPERGYRMRARLHVRDSRAGFYREGTHSLCDAAGTGQLRDGAIAAAGRVIEMCAPSGWPIASIEIAENMAADQRALHLELAPGRDSSAGPAGPAAVLLQSIVGDLVSGISARTSGGGRRAAGEDGVGDSLAALTNGRASGVLRRRAESFFQANRFLLPELVTGVMDAVLETGTVLDLYAGVGLFSLALAGAGRDNVTAIEGDSTSGGDLRRNAATVAGLEAIVEPVEAFLRRRRRPAATVIVDPPRTGLSPAAAEALAMASHGRVVYVSCDPPTMARDTRKLLDGGYRLASLRAFDLFPNTPHVEMLGVFDRVAGAAEG